MKAPEVLELESRGETFKERQLDFGPLRALIFYTYEYENDV